MPATDAIDRAVLAERLANAVRAAGAYALTKFRAPLKSWTKGRDSPVTEVDVAVDEMLRERLGGAAPGYGWLSEESADDGARCDMRHVWIVDPLDGTRAYLAGLPDWTVVAALVDNGRPVLAAIFAPFEDALFTAAAGEGARRNGAPIAASAGTTLASARIAGPKRYLDALGDEMERMPRVHSLALRLARVAAGTLDAAFAGGSSHDWDLAAADLLVHEAGGMLTTLDGRHLVYNRPNPVHEPLVAAGHARHRALIDRMRGRGEFT